MRRLAIPLVLFVAACTGNPSATGGGNAAITATFASAPVSASDLSGRWVIGGTVHGEPQAGGVVSCDADQILTLTQTGVRLQGSLDSCAGLCTKQEQLDGTNHEGTVHLEGGGNGNLNTATSDTDVGTTSFDVSYDLTYNAKTQHLVGKRLGQNFWAAPLIRPSCAPSATPAPAGSTF